MTRNSAPRPGPKPGSDSMMRAYGWSRKRSVMVLSMSIDFAVGLKRPAGQSFDQRGGAGLPWQGQRLLVGQGHSGGRGLGDTGRPGAVLDEMGCHTLNSGRADLCRRASGTLAAIGGVVSVGTTTSRGRGAAPRGRVAHRAGAPRGSLSPCSTTKVSAVTGAPIGRPVAGTRWCQLAHPWCPAPSANYSVQTVLKVE